MSLWSNTPDAKSMPTWYARHCMITGLMTKNGKIDLAEANTQFADGDCVIYFSNDPFTGLQNGGVYYLKRHPDFKYAVLTEIGQPAIFISPKENTEHLFIKYDTKETTKDGTVRPALFPIDAELAKKRIGGLVSPGWWRVYHYQDSEKKDRVKVELLVAVKKMVGDGSVKPETYETPALVFEPITKDWKCNTPCEFKIVVDPKDSTGKHMKFKWVDFDSSAFESISLVKAEGKEDITEKLRTANGEWADEILVESKEIKFEILFPFKEGQPSPIKFVGTLEVSHGSDVDFESATFKFEKDVINEVTRSTVNHVSVDDAIVA